MTLDNAKNLVKRCAEQMSASYGKPVFDEWAIVAFSGKKGRLLDYIGPRKEGFKQNFLADASSLLAGLLSSEYQPGDFEFARQGVGTGFESFMAIGRDVYLICNNTGESMDEITKDPKWIGAQVPFVELSDAVRADPIAVQP